MGAMLCPECRSPQRGITLPSIAVANVLALIVYLASTLVNVPPDDPPVPRTLRFDPIALHALRSNDRERYFDLAVRRAHARGVPEIEIREWLQFETAIEDTMYFHHLAVRAEVEGTDKAVLAVCDRRDRYLRQHPRLAETLREVDAGIAFALLVSRVVAVLTTLPQRS